MDNKQQKNIKQEQPKQKPIIFQELKRISKEQVTEYDLVSQNTYDSFYEEKKNQKIQKHSRSSRHKKISKKITKSNIKRTPEQTTLFQQEEKIRYQNPTSPFEYTVEDKKVVVAPACKKMSENSNNKARDHFLLKSTRPSYVTLLSVVRDAASKLPNGRGTRNDICTLLRESQFINSEIPMERMSSVVSGALDRLHYEADPCVKFDIDKKLWFYLHRNKKIEELILVKKEKKQESKKGNEQLNFINKNFVNNLNENCLSFCHTFCISVKNLNRKSLLYQQDHSISRELSGELEQEGIIKEVNSGVQSGEVVEKVEKTPEELEQERLEEERRQRIEELKQKQAELKIASEKAQIQQKQDLKIEKEAFQNQLKSQFTVNFQTDLQNANPINQQIRINIVDDNSEIKLEESDHITILPEENLEKQKFNYILSNYQWYKNSEDSKVYVALPISWQVFIQDDYPQSKLIYKLGIQQNYDEEHVKSIEFLTPDKYSDTSNVEVPHSKFCSTENIKNYIDGDEEAESSQHFLFGLVSQESFSNNLQVGEIFTKITQEQSNFLSAEFFQNYKNLIIILLFVLKVQMGISGLDSSNVCNSNFIESISDQIQNELNIISGDSEDKIEISYSECKEATEYQQNPHITDIFDIQHLLIPIEQNSDVKSGELILEHLKDIRFDYAIFFQNISEAPILQHLITYDIQKNYKILQLKKLFYNQKSIINLHNMLETQSYTLQTIEAAKQTEADELNEQFKDLFDEKLKQQQLKEQKLLNEQNNTEQNPDQKDVEQNPEPIVDIDIEPFTTNSKEVLINFNEIETKEQKFVENLQHINLDESFMTYFKNQLGVLKENESTIEDIQTKKIFEKQPHQKVKLIQLVQIVENFVKYAKEFVFPDFKEKSCYTLFELKNQSLDCPEPLALCNLKFLQDLGKKNIDHSLFYDLFNFKFDKEVDIAQYFEIMHLYLLKLYQCSFIQQRAQKDFEDRPLYEREQNHKNIGLRQKNYFDNQFSIDNIFDIATIKYATEIDLDQKETENILI